DPPRSPWRARGPSGTARVARDRAGTIRACSSKGRLPATARRRTRRAATRPRRSERLLVPEQPTLRLEEIAAARMPESTQPAGGDDAVAWDDDRQAVLAARLPYRARGTAERHRDLAIGTGLATGNALHHAPDPALEFRAANRQRQIELRVRVLAVPLELPHHAVGKAAGRILERRVARQVAQADERFVLGANG